MSGFLRSACFLLIVLGGRGWAAQVEGRVVDGQAKPIYKAIVTVRGEATSVSDENGVFRLALLPGDYEIRVTKEGFTQAVRNWRVGTEPKALGDIELAVKPLPATITVIESAAPLTGAISSATRTLTPLTDVPQSVSIVGREQIRDQMMMSIADVVRYVPGISSHQGENNRDQVIIRGQNSSADFFVNGVRDDVQYFRDLYNLERVEALKGPNAMTFGRGGGGGVINRVTKEASFQPYQELSLQGGAFGDKRAGLDLGRGWGNRVAFRLNGMLEDAGSFRNRVDMRRWGVAPTATWQSGKQTKLTFGFERFEDRRVADRGITSYLGRPAAVDISTFYGNPEDSRVRAGVNSGSFAIEHQRGGLNLRNRTQIGNVNRGYRNYLAGAVTADAVQVAISAYDNATERLNAFSQTDLSYNTATGVVKHTFLGGVEVGRQLTSNFRNTGYFGNSATSILVPFASPEISTLASFRQSPSDANNHIETRVGAVYLQDQLAITRFVRVIAGLRADQFDLRYLNRRNGDRLRRIDNLLSPRLGLVVKPKTAVSLYANYSVSYLPSSGDQFSSLTTITQQVKPEKFENYEAGVKWDLSRNLALTAAVYRLDRTNTRSTDPNDATRIVQTGSQRTNGFEAGWNGSLTRVWRVSGGYSYQDAFISSATVAARQGAQVGQVPHHMFSLWNQYQVAKRLSAGLGLVNRADMYAAVDNTVRLPGYSRVDAAVYYSLTEKLRLQCNVENLLDRRYYANADNNTNISPGSPRAVRVGLTARF